jgi:hypothetical protein
VIFLAVALAGCGDRRPFPQERFEAFARQCNLKATTYSPPSGFWRKYISKEALIDFSHEANPEAADKCFEEANLAFVNPPSDRGIIFVWETRQ